MIGHQSPLYMRSISGISMERLGDLKQPYWVAPAEERRHSPIANAAALVLAIILISAPWITGVAWLAVYFWTRSN